MESGLKVGQQQQQAKWVWSGRMETVLPRIAAQKELELALRLSAERERREGPVEGERTGSGRAAQRRPMRFSCLCRGPAFSLTLSCNKTCTCNHTRSLHQGLAQLRLAQLLV